MKSIFECGSAKRWCEYRGYRIMVVSRKIAFKINSYNRNETDEIILTHYEERITEIFNIYIIYWRQNKLGNISSKLFNWIVTKWN